MTVHIKRVYDEPSPDDGKRILVDRLWPRGLSKDKAQINIWMKEAAPSNELRKWFGHDPAKWDEFQKRYQAELEANPDTLKQLRDEIGSGKATLVYAAHDSQHSNAAFLKNYL